VGKLILTARLSVAENIQMKNRMFSVVFKQEEKREKQSTLHTHMDCRRHCKQLSQ